MSISKMVAWCKKADDAYFNSGKPIVSDSKYDKRREKLQAAVKHKEGTKEEIKEAKKYLKGTGAKVRSSRRDTKLPFFISSLDKLKSDDFESFVKWFKKIQKTSTKLNIKLDNKINSVFFKTNVAMSVSPKLDGVSLTLAYKKGKLINAYTRGDGKTGQSKLKHAKTITTIPKTLRGLETNALEKTGLVYVRGELVANKKRFSKYNKKHKRFKTILNSVSGWINSDTPDSFSKVLDFIAYDIREEDGEEINYNVPPKQLYKGAGAGASKITTLNLLVTYGFFTYQDIPNGSDSSVVTFSAIKPFFKKVKEILDNVNDKAFPYPVDGVVVEVSDNYLRNILGMSGSNRPEYAKAFKYSAADSVSKEGKETKVRELEVTVSKNGAQKPVIVFDTVNINGANVGRATGYNFAYLVEKKIGVGSVVSVVKSGGIIPHAALVRKPKDKKDILPKKCLCGAKLVHTSADSYCSKPQKCKYTQYALLENTIKKLKVVGLGAKNIKSLFDFGFYDLPTLLGAKEKQLREIPNFGDATIVTIRKAIPEKLFTLTEPELMEISGVFTRPGLSLANAVLKGILLGDITEGERYDLYKEKLAEYKKWYKQIKKLRKGK